MATKSQSSFIDAPKSRPDGKIFIKESRERIGFYGPAALSDLELLALVLEIDPRDLRAAYPDLTRLYNAPTSELQDIPGLGKVKASRLKAALELGQRLAYRAKLGKEAQITSPQAVHDLMYPKTRDLKQEHLYVIHLDTKNYVMEVETAYIGNVNTSIVRVCEIYRKAIQNGATSVILVHNHPSGDPTPSPEDVQVTRRIIEAGKMLDIELLDHIVMGNGAHVSLKEHGLAFS